MLFKQKKKKIEMLRLDGITDLGSFLAWLP